MLQVIWGYMKCSWKACQLDSLSIFSLVVGHSGCPIHSLPCSFSNQSNDENHHSGPKVVYVGDVHRVYQMDSHNIPLHLLYEVKWWFSFCHEIRICLAFPTTWKQIYVETICGPIRIPKDGEFDCERSMRTIPRCFWYIFKFSSLQRVASC